MMKNMHRRSPSSGLVDTVTFWWLSELFGPQKVPETSGRSAADSHPDTSPRARTVRLSAGRALPWDRLPPLRPLRGKDQEWRHRVYLGVYELSATYEVLFARFGDDPSVYDERPSGTSACATVLLDQSGAVVPGSGVLSSALWAVGHLPSGSPADPASLTAFADAQDSFARDLDEFEAHRAEDGGSHPLDETSLEALLRFAQGRAGVDGDEGLATDEMRVTSYAVAADHDEADADADFLNSFYLDDLDLLRGRLADDDLGLALRSYLTSDVELRVDSRVDVVNDHDVVDKGVALDRLPQGRWPAAPDHHLARSQQFAVNHALHDLGPAAGLTGVNGPPGTGKTTMLRDLLAGNVVERARRLARLRTTDEAFTQTVHSWTAGSWRRHVPQLRDDLVGFEMVVASANNAAVENVSAELPAASAIAARWRGRAEYFGDLATAVRQGSTSTDDDAWGLVAATLGRKGNRARFRSAFWFDGPGPAEDGTPLKPGMQSLLKGWRTGDIPFTRWPVARDDFSKAEQRVETVLTPLREAERRYERLHSLEADLARAEVALGDQRRRRDEAGRCATRSDHEEREARVVLEAASLPHGRHLATRPGLVEMVLSLGRAGRSWREALEPLAATLTAAESAHGTALGRYDQAREAASRAESDLASAETELRVLMQELSKVRSRCAEDVRRYGKAHPGGKRTAEDRELHAPWLTAELDEARSELFLAALTLHADFIAASAARFEKGLRAAMDVLAGDVPDGLEPEKVRAAWQLFFLVVPLVSTTFASADRMFAGLGREVIGWLFIDEAGQASPQFAAGSIWRSRRVVAVGDPLQLKPVVTIPKKAQAALATGCGVSSTWVPPTASVQTLADRVSRYGTTLSSEGDDVWVSAPLRVHRRCDEPMFSYCNAVAYGGLMVDGVPPRVGSPGEPDLYGDPGRPRIAASHWAHEHASHRGSHVQPGEIRRAESALEYLRREGVDLDDVMLISPFKDVANELEVVAKRYPGLVAGSIHTAQGKEADVIVLVLGGDPDKPGAKAWAAESVNLVNVAVSRAKRRLYVIGDRDAWKQHSYFDVLADVLTP